MVSSIKFKKTLQLNEFNEIHSNIFLFIENNILLFNSLSHVKLFKNEKSIEKSFLVFLRLFPITIIYLTLNFTRKSTT